jgi:hypothetical protein
MSVLTLTEVKTHLNITVETYDAELPGFIAAAESAISRRVGPLEVAAATAVLKGGGRAMLVVPTLPAVSLTSVTDVWGTVVDVSRLRLDRDGVLEFKTCGCFSAKSYTVAYTVGWGTVTEDVWSGPADLHVAALELARHLWSSQRGGGQRPGAPSSTELSNTLPGSAFAMPFRVAQLIEPYLPLGGP